MAHRSSPRRPRAARPAAQPSEAFARRCAVLRSMLPHDAAAAGDQAFKLLEEYLEYLARETGYHTDDPGGLGRYTQWLARTDLLSDVQLAQIETYTQARNCLAHTYGLQASPHLAEEITGFIELLLKATATVAGQVMTGPVRTVTADQALASVRDLMVREGYGRLPVMQGSEVVGLLIERDLVAAAAHGDGHHTVAEVLPDGSLARLRCASPQAPLAEVIDALQEPGVVALLVTARGDCHGRPLGIITHADLLYRLP